MLAAGHKIDMARGLARAFLIAVLLHPMCSFAFGQQKRWATERDLAQQLASKVTVSWSNSPLGRALSNLGAAQRVAVVLDRRIDPDRPLDLALKGETLADGFLKIAEKVGAGHCQLGPVAYFGPTAVAAKLRTLSALRLEEIRSLPAPAERKCLLMRTSHWDDLAEPRQLIAQLAEETGMELVGMEKIPHDLWAQADLPPLAWIDRLTLLAAQFDLTFQIKPDGHRIELVPIPEKVMVARSYRAGPNASSLAKQWSKALPSANFKIAGNAIRVSGLLEDHELIERRFRGSPAERVTVTAGKELYQLSLENAALGKVIDQLADRLDLQFSWDRAAIEMAGVAADPLISVKVQDADLDELLSAVLKDTGLAFVRDNRKVSIYPASRANGGDR